MPFFSLCLADMYEINLIWLEKCQGILHQGRKILIFFFQIKVSEKSGIKEIHPESFLLTNESMHGTSDMLVFK